MKRAALPILIVMALLVMAAPASAVVTNSTRSVTYTPSSSTTVFTVTFHFTATNQIQVTKTEIATQTDTILTQGTDYSVTLPVGSVSGYVTLSTGITSTHTLTIDRVVPITQTTSFASQGRYLPKSLEDALDKLTMIVQQLATGTVSATDITTAINNHEAESDPHSVYLKLLGRTGGQTASGGTASGDDLTFSSTTHATKGDICLGASCGVKIDETNTRIGIGGTPAYELDLDGSLFVNDTNQLLFDLSVSSPSPNVIFGSATGNELHIQADTNVAGGTGGASVLLYPHNNGTYPDDLAFGADRYSFRPLSLSDASAFAVLTSTSLTLKSGSDIVLPNAGGGIIYTPTVLGGSSSGDDLTLYSNISSDGFIYFGAAQTSGYDEANDYIGIGTATPSYELEVSGDIYASGDVYANTFIYGSTSPGGDLYIHSTDDATFGDINIGSGALVVDELNARVGVGTTTPSDDFDVQGHMIAMRVTEANTTGQTISFSTDCNRVFYANGTSPIIHTLPDITAASTGCTITFIETAADGGRSAGLYISPDSSVAITGTCVGDVPRVAGTLQENKLSNTDKDAQLLTANSEQGDSITIMSDGTGKWYITSCVGAWTEEP